jgi:hypothetical protein
MDAKGKASISINKVNFDTSSIYHFNEITTDLQITPLLGKKHPNLNPNHLITKCNETYQSTYGQIYRNKLELIAFEHTTY